MRLRKEKKAKNKISFEDNIHKIYFVLALIIGVIISIGMPLFSEPDGQWHYSVSTNIVHLSNDLSAYGEPIGTGTSIQKQSYQRGDHFEQYFENKIVKMSISDIPRTNNIPPVLSSNYLGHIIPAIGVWIGYHIYPSVGVMIVVGRLFSSLISSFIICLIIKYLKKGKLVIFALSLTPVILGTISSLSYDTFSYILALLVFLITINMLVVKKITWKFIAGMVGTTILVLLGAKTNIKLLLLLFPLVILSVMLSNGKIKRAGFKVAGKKLWFSVTFAGALILIGGGGLLIAKPSLMFSGYRIIINFLVNLSPGISTNNMFLGVLASPYPSYNYMPYWVAGAWYILLLLAMLSEEKFVSFKLLSFGALGIFILNFLGVYHGFLTFLSGGYSPAPNSIVMGAIYGQQGRYFTPFLPLLALGLANSEIKIQVNSKQTIMILTSIFAILSNLILLFATLFGIYYL